MDLRVISLDLRVERRISVHLPIISRHLAPRCVRAQATARVAAAAAARTAAAAARTIATAAAPIPTTAAIRTWNRAGACDPPHYQLHCRGHH